MPLERIVNNLVPRRVQLRLISSNLRRVSGSVSVVLDRWGLVRTMVILERTFLGLFLRCKIGHLITQFLVFLRIVLDNRS